MLYWGDYLAMGIVYTVAVFLIGYTYGAWRQMGDDQMNLDQTLAWFTLGYFGSLVTVLWILFRRLGK